MDDNFSDEQKRYLEGLASGLQIAKLNLGDQKSGEIVSDYGLPVSESPDQANVEAQNKFLQAGEKLCNEEKAKRELHPFEMWDQMLKNAEEGVYPKGVDVFRYKYHGLFYVAPAQDSFMSRLRLPNGVITATQLKGVADIANKYAGPYSHVTTRANLQLREIDATNATKLLTSLQDIGVMNRGSGADNIRNVTGNPLSGIAIDEIYDTRELAREMHYYILYHRDMYGLPRKFNIAFDGGGAVSVLEDTNDIGFAAVHVSGQSQIEDGVYFRLQLGGITGHLDFARDVGLLLTPGQCIPIAKAIIRVFIESGNRTDRTKARLKYVLDDWGLDKFMQAVKDRLDFVPIELSLDQCETRKPIDRMAHVGVHAQRQDGYNYVGVVLPVGRIESQQMYVLADIAEKYGNGDLRLTVWQNVIISDIKDADVEQVKKLLEDAGMHWSATNIRANLISCTGSWGCKFANADTKAHAMAIAEHVESKLELDQPINIHLTGCHHSCAQHYIGDIGLLGAKVDIGEDLDPVDGFDVYLGGGFGDDQAIAKEFKCNVIAEDLPILIEHILQIYMRYRIDSQESFLQFTQRTSVDELLGLIEKEVEAA